MMVLASQLSLLTKDTSADAFLSDDTPALVYRSKVKEQFGLADPMVIAVVNTSPQGVFNPKTLALVEYLSEGLMGIPNINPDRVVSRLCLVSQTVGWIIYISVKKSSIFTCRSMTAHDTKRTY